MAVHSLFDRRVEDAVDLDDVVVEQPLHLDHRARRIWRLAPEFGLRLIHQGRETVQVADIHREPYAILQAGALRLRDQLEIEEGLTNARLGIFKELVGRGIDALHAGDKDKVAGAHAETPGPLRFYG